MPLYWCFCSPFCSPFLGECLILGVQVNYFLKDKQKNKSAINAIFYHHGRHKLAAGVSCVKKYWGNNRAKVVPEYPDAETINIKLEDFEIEIKAICAAFNKKEYKPTTAEIKAEYNRRNGKPAPKAPTAQGGTFTNFLETFKNQYEKPVYNKYNNTYNLLLRYEKEHKTKLHFESIDLDFYDNFKAWFFTLTYKPSKTAPPKPYTKNYYGSIIKAIKKAMKASGPESRAPLHQNMSYKSDEFKVEHEEADTVYLSIAELEKIHAFTPTPQNVQSLTKDHRSNNLKSLADALQLCKQKFLIGCFTALRVSDFNRLSEINLSADFIRITPQKGTNKNAPVVIPIHRIIKEILESGFDIATPISDQKLNKHLKKLCRLVNITQPVSVVRTEGGKQVTRTFEKCDLISTHTARRSGATNMYLAGIPSISIMRITGHRTESSFMTYIKITQEENAFLLQNHAFFK